MAGVEHPEWEWEKTDAARSGSSGDIAKFFKNEGTKNPGVLRKGAPSDEATLTAREVVQNSWDAARELKASFEAAGRVPPNFELEFEFSELTGQAKRDLIGRLGLESVHRRLVDLEKGDPKVRAAIGLPADCALDHLSDDSPLRILRIIEKGATGMYGPFEGDQSKLYLALVSIGYTQKAEGSGGSYGYGKAGLISASAIRTVVAHTCFQPRSPEPHVTRRLLGMTYWGQHKSDASYTGFARFGHFSDGWTKPFENQQADQVAEGLGFTLRDPESPTELGTSFLLVDPVIEPHDLMKAIERNWWPALETNEFVVYATVKSADGTSMRIDAVPRRDPVIDSFITAWELATLAQDASQSNKVRRTLRKHAGLELGSLGLVAKVDGWSYAQVEQPTDPDEDDVDGSSSIGRQSSLVALVRGPKMVVEYLVCAAGKTPFLRGVFVADEAVDDLLRQTEPKAHDSWQTKSKDLGDGADGLAPKIASEVLKRIRTEVREMQKRLKPPPPSPEDVDLPEFQKLFKELMSGGGTGTPPPPPAGDRDVSLRFLKRKLIAAGVDTVRLDAKVGFKLSDSFKDGDEAHCTIRLDYAFIEDGRKGESCELQIEAPSGFVRTADGEYSGQLGRDEVTFTITSSPYASDWTARLVASGRIPKSPAGGGQ